MKIVDFHRYLGGHNCKFWHQILEFSEIPYVVYKNLDNGLRTSFPKSDFIEWDMIILVCGNLQIPLPVQVVN